MPSQNTSSQAKTLEVWVRSTIFQLTLMLVTLLLGPLMLFMLPFPFLQRYKLAQVWVGIMMWSIEHICGIDYTVTGLENIPRDGNGIVLSKHQSSWETIALQKLFPPQVYLLKKSLLWLPVWGWAMAALKPIAIDRSNQKAALRILIKEGTRHLQDGLWVVVFPEGTRVAPGAVKKFNAGGCLLAHRSGYPVIPVAHNAGEFWPRYSFFKYPGTVQVRIGPPMYGEGRKPNEFNQEVEAWINNAVREIESNKQQI
ncbi:MAG: lysophospholipid acyltransferase family protein [Gammaproteobacteria bacterium]